MSLKEFQIQSKLGQGSYSSVYKVLRLTDNLPYAMKKVKLINLNQKQRQNALNQVRILASIHHPNIIGYKEAFIDPLSDTLIIIMQYASSGDLHQKLTLLDKTASKLPEKQIWKIFTQIIKGLRVLHNMNIIHRDLKSANIFLGEDGGVKIGDLNVSKVMMDGMCETQTGTPYYASPEVWKDEPYDMKSDIWAAGVILYEMTCGRLPFKADDIEGLYKKVVRGVYEKVGGGYSAELAGMIRGMLQVAPQGRPDCEKILGMIDKMQRKGGYVVEKSPHRVSQHTLLDTIKMTKNVRIQIDNLPKPDYTSTPPSCNPSKQKEKVKKSDSRGSCPKNQLLPFINSKPEERRLRYLSEKKKEKVLAAGGPQNEEQTGIRYTESKLIKDIKKKLGPYLSAGVTTGAGVSGKGLLELPKMFDEADVLARKIRKSAVKSVQQ